MCAPPSIYIFAVFVSTLMCPSVRDVDCVGGLCNSLIEEYIRFAGVFLVYILVFLTHIRSRNYWNR